MPRGEDRMIEQIIGTICIIVFMVMPFYCTKKCLTNGARCAIILSESEVNKNDEG
jgi:hypothetical protein